MAKIQKNMQRKMAGEMLRTLEMYIITIIRVANESRGKYKGSDQVDSARDSLLTALDNVGAFDADNN